MKTYLPVLLLPMDIEHEPERCISTTCWCRHPNTSYTSIPKDRYWVYKHYQHVPYHDQPLLLSIQYNNERHERLDIVSIHRYGKQSLVLFHGRKGERPYIENMNLFSKEFVPLINDEV